MSNRINVLTGAHSRLAECARPALAYSVLLLTLLLTACGAEGVPSASVDLGATADAARYQLQAAQRAQTATAQAISAAAAREAKQTRQAMDAANARATTEAKQTAQAQAAASATIQAYAFNLTVTADALALAQQQAQATATADARGIQVALEKQSATVTAQAVEHQRLQAEQDAQAARRTSDFFAYFWAVVWVVAVIVLFIFGMYAVNQWLAVFALRRTVIETRTGTVFFVREGNQFTAQLLNPPSMLPVTTDERDEFADSQAHVIDAEADVIRVGDGKGERFMPKLTDAEWQTREGNRKLVMRLLRAAMMQVGGDAKRIPTAKDLGWAPATWVKAVSLLKPHVVTKEGRGGGTVCADTYPTLAQLYAAVGERRVTPLSGGAVTA